VQGVRPLREGSNGLGALLAGYLLPSLAAALAVAVPPLGRPLAVGAGLLMVAGQVATKAALLRRAGQVRAITLPAEQLERRSP
jgi:hypothetical protein